MMTIQGNMGFKLTFMMAMIITLTMIMTTTISPKVLLVGIIIDDGTGVIAMVMITVMMMTMFAVLTGIVI